MANMILSGNTPRGMRPGGFYGMFDDFFRDARRGFMGGFRLDLKEDEKAYCVEAELPGVARDEIALDFNDGKLSIDVTRNEEKEEKGDNYLHRERTSSAMRRCLYLADAASEGITASLADGILKINVPKAEKIDSATRIEIQ